ncbi:pirin family protein [Flectobacillus roseus]|uniref:Pirin family protein n=1 Tax=Flectobacillus roseus TaxID=502259 RepID=A0ABT6YAH5_9BACT|nr:pirin family protein [Flectobacillus roseus]MDI9860098.1 pirin family protein [Flectobacillus roseus]
MKPLKKTLHLADTRGKADHGWLKAKHTFSFSNYHDPSRVHFGALRVLNDDYIAGGMGFGMHPHDNMEIITIPTSGVVAHKDSFGNYGTITAGEIQVMSAGTGIYHSEFNHQQNEPLTLFQIWLFPNQENVKPRYAQQSFDVVARHNRFQTVVAPANDQQEDALWIYQDAYFSIGNFEAGQDFSYQIKRPGNGLYVFVIEGEVQVAEENLKSRDGLGLENLQEAHFKTTTGVELLLMEVPE